MKSVLQSLTIVALIAYTIYNKSCENATIEKANLIDKANSTEIHTYVYKIHKIISELSEHPELQLKLKDCSDVQADHYT